MSLIENMILTGDGEGLVSKLFVIICLPFCE